MLTVDQILLEFKVIVDDTHTIFRIIGTTDKTNESIKAILKQIIDIVDESEKALFQSEISLKVSGIRVM